jgi:hypothetical protein
MPNSSRNKTAVADGISLTTASWRIPFRSVEPLAWALDCIIILTSSILSGYAYHRWVVGGGGDVETSLAVGLLVAVNFTTVLAARGSYKPLSLIALQSRIKEAVTIWLIVFSLSDEGLCERRFRRAACPGHRRGRRDRLLCRTLSAAPVRLQAD